MATQTYATHRHQPRLTIVGTIFMVIAVVGFVAGGGVAGPLAISVGFFGLVGAIFTLLTISRLYTTALQDRIIKLEMRVRCLEQLTPAQQETVARLKKAQLVALRFASDEELAALAERAEREQLSADQIKRAIKNWIPDLDRT